MRVLILIVGLIGLSLPAFALEPDTQETLRVGQMARFNFAEPAPVPDTVFYLRDESEHRLSDFKGTPVLVNFWATWCPPCRKEMPSLDRLAAELGGEAQVVTIASGRNTPRAVDALFGELHIQNLPKYLDPQGALARDMSALGLPVSILIDARGRVVGRLIGDAEWDAPEAAALIRAIAAE